MFRESDSLRRCRSDLAIKSPLSPVAAEQLGLQTMPTSFLIDSKGVVRARRDGFREEDVPAIEADVRALLTDRVLDDSSHGHVAATMDAP